MGPIPRKNQMDIYSHYTPQTHIWVPNNLTKSNIKLLNKVQHLMSILITRAQRSTAQLTLDTILGFEPIDLKLEQTALIRAIALKAENHWKPAQKLYEKKEYLTSQEKIDLKLRNILKEYHTETSDRISPYTS